MSPSTLAVFIFVLAVVASADPVPDPAPYGITRGQESDDHAPDPEIARIQARTTEIINDSYGRMQQIWATINGALNVTTVNHALNRVLEAVKLEAMNLNVAERRMFTNRVLNHFAEDFGFRDTYLNLVDSPDIFVDPDFPREGSTDARLKCFLFRRAGGIGYIFEDVLDDLRDLYMSATRFSDARKADERPLEPQIEPAPTH